MRQANREQLTRIMREARKASWAQFEHINETREQVPYLEIINPPLWEIGHVAWFQEFWCVRDGNFDVPCLRANGDQLYDSARIDHQDRWALPLPAMAATREYVDAVLEGSLETLAQAPANDSLAMHRLAAAHEMMHYEAFAYTWQTLAYPRPSVQSPEPVHQPASRMIEFDGGAVEVGSRPDEGFVFDNEQWAHPVAVTAFAIQNNPVSYGQFREFVDDGGYSDKRHWSGPGWAWLQRQAQRLPRYWREDGQTYLIRRHDQWRAFDPDLPMLHVNAYEAQAFCHWAGARLPSEAEWLMAARSDEDFAWGNSAWEWTGSTFGPFDGFSPGHYREYSEPWFGDHLVVRGGSYVTPRHLIDDRFRNFYMPQRNDPYLGFRVCRSLT